MLDSESLSREHAELSAIAAELLASVAPATPAVDRPVALRWRLNRQLSAHLVKEDRLLYPALQASSDPETAAIATRFATEMGGLAAAYRSYMADWPAERIARQWGNFQNETRTVIAALHHRILREETELYPRMKGATGRSAADHGFRPDQPIERLRIHKG